MTTVNAKLKLLAAEEAAKGWSALPLGETVDVAYARVEPFDESRRRTFLHTDKGVYASLNPQIADRVTAYLAVLEHSDGRLAESLRVRRTERVLDNGRRVTGIEVAL